jgi:hypothetical protein
MKGATCSGSDTERRSRSPGPGPGRARGVRRRGVRSDSGARRAPDEPGATAPVSRETTQGSDPARTQPSNGA